MFGVSCWGHFFASVKLGIYQVRFSNLPAHCPGWVQSSAWCSVCHWWTRCMQTVMYMFQRRYILLYSTSQTILHRFSNCFDFEVTLFANHFFHVENSDWKNRRVLYQCPLMKLLYAQLFRNLMTTSSPTRRLYLNWNCRQFSNRQTMWKQCDLLGNICLQNILKHTYIVFEAAS